MHLQLRIFGNLAVRVGTILIATSALLALARDSLHVFVHDSFVWLVVLKQGLFGALFDLMGLTRAAEIAAGLASRVFSLFGLDVPLWPQAHWTYVFVLLALAFGAYAHALRDVKARPAFSVFCYGNAMAWAFAGGVLAGSAPIAHPGMIAWPLSAMLAFMGTNSAVLAILDATPGRRRPAAGMALLCLSGAALMALVALDLDHLIAADHRHTDPMLVLFLLFAAGFGAWTARFGLQALQVAAPARGRGILFGAWVFGVVGATTIVVVAGEAAFWMGRTTQTADLTAPGTVFQECHGCPEMVTIPAGRFVMGTTEEEALRLDSVGLWNPVRHTDEFPGVERETAGFALSRTEVTIGQFEAFMRATGYEPGGWCWGLHDGELDFHQGVTWRDPGFQQNPDHPIVCVNWLDAQAYTRWLRVRTGQDYRLPTETEWEYAARGGTRTIYPWGDDVHESCAFSNGADMSVQAAFPEWKTFECDDGSVHTAPTGSYQANEFGLFDMKGNVWEWVNDCYGPLNSGRPSDEAAIRACADRVIRGGSWNYGPDELRAANRDSHDPYIRGAGLGFRVARTL